MQLCRIALCTDMPGMSVWPGTRLREPHIPVRRSSCCHRNKVAIFIFTIADVWDRRSRGRSAPDRLHVTGVFLHIHHSSVQQLLLSVPPLRCRAGAYAYTNTSNTSVPLLSLLRQLQSARLIRPL